MKLQMVRLLSKSFSVVLILMFALNVAAQPTTGAHGTDDYKDAKSHEKFRKRRLAVSSYQINRLKEGALVVRLKTNSMVINELKKRGDNEGAERARLEQTAVNLNMMRAFKDNYNFSKVYFVYSYSSDSLEKGMRSGFFLDSNLNVKNDLKLNESFYLLAESDFVYNSSIGFVPEDSAKFVYETGNPSASEFPIVIKNRYGHQLKNPFPYAPAKFVYTKNIPYTDVTIEGKPVTFAVTGALNAGRTTADKPNAYKYNGKALDLSIPRSMTYEVLSQYVEQLNTDLEQFYRESAGYSEKNPNYQDAKPFMY